MVRIPISGIFIGQFLALLNTGTGVFSKLLLEQEVNTPLFQLVWAYLLIFLIFLACNIRKKTRLESKTLLKSVGIAVLDTQSNFFLILGFQFTSFISVFAILNLSVVIVMALSRVFMNRRISLKQGFGAAACLVGVCCVMVSDLWSEEWVWQSSMLGDGLVVLGTTMYAVQGLDRTNVGVEALMCSGVDSDHYLLVLGGAGSFLVFIESAVFEWASISQTQSWQSCSFYAGFAITLGVMYTMIPGYIMKFGATMFNLSLLTTSVYGLVFGIMLFGAEVSWLYLFGYCLILGGLVLYSLEEEKELKESLLE